MDTSKITVKAVVSADKQKTWDYYTQPKHITQWNFADPSWHCPSASNDLQVGGRYIARMEAKDGSFGFDFEGIYSELDPGNRMVYGLSGREVIVELQDMNGKTEITVSFDPENENDLELQRNGWQMILNNFKDYTEQN